MDSFAARANSLATFAGTCLAVLAALTACTDVFHEPHPTAVVKLAKVERLVPLETGRDEAYLAFEIDANLTSVWSWNVKELFVFIGAEYASKQRKVNSVSLWDRTIERKEDAVLSLPYVRNKYKLVDSWHNLRGMPFNLTLYWNVIPVVGRLQQHSMTFTGFELPRDYVRQDSMSPEWRGRLEHGSPGSGSIGRPQQRGPRRGH